MNKINFPIINIKVLKNKKKLEPLIWLFSLLSWIQKIIYQKAGFFLVLMLKIKYVRKRKNHSD